MEKKVLNERYESPEMNSFEVELIDKVLDSTSENPGDGTEF